MFESLWKGYFDTFGAMFGVVLLAIFPTIAIILIVIIRSVVKAITNKQRKIKAEKARKEAQARKIIDEKTIDALFHEIYVAKEKGDFAKAYDCYMSYSKLRTLDADDMYDIGRICENGKKNGWVRTGERYNALDWYNKAAAGGNLSASFQVSRDKYETAVKNGDGVAISKYVNEIRSLSSYGCGDAAKMAREFDVISATALREKKDGYLEIVARYGANCDQFAVAESYLNEGTRESIAKSLDWLLLLCKKDFTQAQYLYGSILLQGKHGVEKDVDEGVKWLKEAGESGDIYSAAKVGAHYFNLGDMDNAIYWLKKAKEHENPDILFYLGLAYRRKGASVPSIFDVVGDGDEQMKALSESFDLTFSYDYYVRQAARKGSLKAQKHMEENNFESDEEILRMAQENAAKKKEQEKNNSCEESQV